MKKSLSSLIIYLRSNKGYTIAELLAVLSLFVIISSVMASIIYSTLRGAAKTKINTEVTQNGSAAVSVISQIIEDSRNVTQINGNDLDDCTTNPSSSSLVPTPIVGQIISAPSITLKRIDGARTVIACGPLTTGDTTVIASNGAAIINKDVVSVSSCVFSCSQVVSDPYSIPIVKASFSIAQKNATSLYEGKANASFDVSNSLRVYSP